MADNYEFLLGITDPANLVYRGRAFTWSDLRLLVPQNDVYYYSFTTSATKHTAVYNRVFDAGEGPIRLDIVFGATFTLGASSSAINLIAGEPGPDIAITKGVTSVVGGATSLVGYDFASGNKSAVAAPAGLPTIFKPNTTFLAKVTNLSSGTNPGILFSLAFAELLIPEHIYQG